MTPLARLLTLALLLSGLTGCAGWGSDSWRQPQVQLLRIEPVKLRLHQQEFVLHLQIDNPNDRRLFIRNLDYALRLDDLTLAADQVSLWRSVAGHSRRTFSITARTNLWRHLRPLAKRLRSQQPLHYQLSAELATGLLIHRDLHLSRSGEIMPGDFQPE